MARDLMSGYGKLPVLHGVSIDVDENEVVAIIGPNGAGKSSLLKTIFGLLPMKQGSLSFGGEGMETLKAQERRSRGMALVPQDGGTFPHLSVQDNLVVSYSSLSGRQAQSEAMEAAYTMFPVLGERRRQSARTLSGGERQMLTFVSGIGGKPKFLALDEPTAGLAPSFVHALMQKVVEFKNEGSTVLLVVEENPLEVMSYVDRVYVLRAGEVQAEMTSGELLENQDLQTLFFGTKQ